MRNNVTDGYQLVSTKVASLYLSGVDRFFFSLYVNAYLDRTKYATAHQRRPTGKGQAKLFLMTRPLYRCNNPPEIEPPTIDHVPLTRILVIAKLINNRLAHAKQDKRAGLDGEEKSPNV